MAKNTDIMTIRLLYLLVIMGCFGCKTKTDDTTNSGKDLILKSIEATGADALEASYVSFDFRDYQYTAKREDGIFELSRRIINESDSIVDILNNGGFKRRINNKVITLADSIANSYAASVNSVHYFSVLPYGLDEPAVNHALLEDEKIGSEIYYKIKITFNKDGGGEDFEGYFIYWVHKESYMIDYLAYSYNEADGKGLRFREAINERFFNSVRFVDYNNFKPLSPTSDLESLAKDFTNGRLELVSKIELKNIKLQLINNE
jgi:hypothetical protein